MPLTNNVIVKLNEITSGVSDKGRLVEADTGLIRGIFEDILKGGESYDVEDIESWFENEGSWKDRSVRARIANLAHYVQSRHEQAARLRVVSDGDGSCSGDSCSCGH